jgi:sarcosine oxidase subunit beta
VHYWTDYRDFLEAPADEAVARYTECGCVILRNGEPDGMDLTCLHHDTLGIPYERWDVSTLAAHCPYIDLHRYGPPKRPDDPSFGEPTGGELTGAIHFPRGGFVNDPQLAARNLADAARRKGAAFLFRKRVVSIDRAGGRVAGVTLDDGSRPAAPVVVNAAGPHSSQINAMAGVLGGMAISTRALRQEVNLIPGPADFNGAPARYMMTDHDTGAYLRPDGLGNIMIGGMEPACDPLVWVDDPDSLDRSHTEQWTAQAYRVGLRLPSLGIPGQATGVVDMYDVTDDWIPIYDKSDLPGFYLACGTSGNQFKNGPVAGRMMTALIDHCEAGNDHDAVPCRFPLKHVGGEIDMGAFSRRREVSKESSMSVLG